MLQDRIIERVGDTKTIPVDVRIVLATNRDLEQAVADGDFREDLFYRINVINVTMPALRDRREDIPLLVEHFLTKYGEENGSKRKEISPKALAYMVNYAWPGNVRELENEVQRAMALGDDVIQPEDLSESFFPKQSSADEPVNPGGQPLKEIVKKETEKVERRVILEALRQAEWKKNQTAKILGISRPTLDAKMEAYGLKKDADTGA